MLREKKSSTETAYYLRYSENTLRKSRGTGQLGGRKAPPYIKIGGRIFYEVTDLDNWINSFCSQENTGKNFKE